MDSVGECSICMERFGDDPDHTPKLLLCGHSFCQADLIHLTMKGSIRCPNGCEYTQLGPKGVPGLKSNFALMEIVRSLPKKQEKKCQECHENPVWKFCSNCDTEYCQDCCEKIHAFRSTKNHSLHSGGRPSEPITCQEHKNHPLDLFCKREQVPICILCRLYGEHKSHSDEVDLLVNITSSQQDRVKEVLEKLKNRTVQLQSVSSKMANAEQTLSKNAPKVKALIERHFANLMTEMQLRQSQLLQKVEDEQHKKDVTLRSQRQDIASHISVLNTIYQQANSLLDAERLTLMKNCDIYTRADKVIENSLQLDTDVLDPNICYHLGDDIVLTLRSHGAVGAPPAPILEMDSKCGDSTADVAWLIDTVTVDVLEFSIEISEGVSEEKDFHWAEVNKYGPKVRAATLVDLKNGADYSIRMRARNVSGWSTYSKLETFKTELVPLNTEYKFTNANKTGATGPSQSGCDAAYNATTLKHSVKVHGGIQQWTVPYTATFTITAAGASGGMSQTHQKNGVICGNGAIMRGDLELQAGQVLDIIVGQKGYQGATHIGGGGGGTFVVSRKTPLMVAGGGGSQCGCRVPAQYLTYSNGRIDKKGGKGECAGGSSTPEGGGGSTISATCGEGGAGFSGNGANNEAKSFLNGGVGAQTPMPGGFGGGGGGKQSCAPGGGGGYTGGNCTHSAGGGGSLNTGSDQNNQDGRNQGHGYVSIVLKSC